METPILDRAQAFLLYATFSGDVERTAHAVGVRAVDVLKMAEEEGWNTRLHAILELKKSTKPGDVERGLNRAMNYVQAHRMRLIIERAIQKLTLMNEDEFADYFFSEETTKAGALVKKLASRGLADLASALEKCQSMTYLALSDTAQDRAKREEIADSEESGGQLHAQIAKAMAGVREGRSARAMLFDAQLVIADNQVKANATPQHPNDNDEH